MSAINEVEPETAQSLLDLAKSKGISVDELLRASVAKGSLAKSNNGLGHSERAQAFRAWAAGHSTSTPLLSDEAISRKTIYTR